MLTLYHGGRHYPIHNTEYYLRELASGFDEIQFSISIWDPVYAMIQEEEQIYDRGGQRYLVKQIDGGADEAKIICVLDLDAWKGDLHVGYTNGSATLGQTLEGITPEGWTVMDLSGSNIRRTISGDYTPLQICEACRDTYDVYIRWDNKTRICRVISRAMAPPLGAFATRQLNLREIQYKGKSTDFATRIYPYGVRDDNGNALTIQGATIHGAVYPYPYIENRSYADKIVSVYWSDERYTVAENLYDDAVARLAKLAVPTRSYECSVLDLQATNPELYGNLSFDLFSTATLIDDSKGTSVDYQVVERHVYPYHPELNEIIFDSSPQKITSSIISVAESVEHVQSTIQSVMEREIELATEWLTNADSHVYLVPEENGEGIKEILILNGTEDPATATQVMRINSSGLGFSKTGVNGPYSNAFVFDSELGGHLVADFITSGVLTANVMRAGTIRDLAGQNWWNLETGELHISAESYIDTSNFVTQAQFTAAADRIASEVVEQVGSGIFFNVVPTDNENGTVTLQAHVFLNRTDATQTFSPYFFDWWKKTEDGKDWIGYGYEITVVKTEYGYGGEVEATFLMLEDRYPVNSQGKWVFTQPGSYFTLATSQGSLLLEQGYPLVLSDQTGSSDVYPVFGYDYYE